MKFLFKKKRKPVDVEKGNRRLTLKQASRLSTADNSGGEVDADGFITIYPKREAYNEK